jgi:pseudouridine kinase
MAEGFSPNPEAPALVIGATGVDIVGTLRGELRPGTSNPARIRYSFGGVAHNVSENLARLGQPVNLVTVLGEDEAGNQLFNGLATSGVNTKTVLRTGQYPTGAYLAVINPQGELEFALDDMQVMSSLSPEYFRDNSDLFRDASLVFIDANLPKETLRTIMTLVRRYRLPVCGDPTSVLLAPRFRSYLNHFYLMTPNVAEAAVLCDRPTPVVGRRQALDVARCMVTNGVNVAIITLGAQGLCYATSQTSGYIPAIKTTIVDPTGAGDALTAAVIFALLNDMPLDDAVRLGVSAASLTLRYRGAVVPDLSLEKLYDQLVI